MDINLRASNTNIDFNFDPNILNYTISIPDSANQITITASTDDGGSVRINEQTAHQSGNTFYLPDKGTFTVLIVVTAQNIISGSTIYRLDLVKSKSTYISSISIKGLEHEINFIPLKSEYHYKYTIGSVEELPTINVSAYCSDSAGIPIIKINNTETATATLQEGINEIVINDNESGQENDGTEYSITIEIVIDSNFIDTLLLNSTNYPISHIDKVYKYCTVEIDLTDSNPATCCKYIDDSVIFEKGSSKWDTFFGHYPVVFKEGKERVRVDPNNFKKDIFGNSISTDDGDIMIKFPRRGININYKDEHTLLVSMTDNPNDFRYTYYAHNVGNVARDAFYLGAYKLSLPNNDGKYINTAKGRSISDKYIEKGLGATGGDRVIPDEIFRYYCENNNSFVNCENYVKNSDPYLFETIVRYNGNYWKVINENGTIDTPSEKSTDWELLHFYTMENFFQRVFIQVMYILKYCNLNSQATIGAGFVSTGTYNYSRTNARNKTGYTDTYGMDSELVRDSITNYRNASVSQPSVGYNVNDYHVKLFGIEDLWGNSWEYITGLQIDQRLIDIIETSLNQGSQYVPSSKVTEYTNDVRYLKIPLGTSHNGFITASTQNGAFNQYFCDLGRIDNPSEIPGTSGIKRVRAIFNCGANDKNYAGIFACGVQSQVSNYSKSNFNWFNQVPRFEPYIFSSARTSTSTLSEKPINWSTFNYYFVCNANNSLTARLMYI